MKKEKSLSPHTLRLINKTSKKLALIKFLGGKCKKCGEKRFWVLEFHHKNPMEKEFQMSYLMRSSNIRTLLKEAKKCDLLCSNCHKTVHFNDEHFNEHERDIKKRTNEIYSYLKEDTSKIQFHDDVNNLSTSKFRVKYGTNLTANIKKDPKKFFERYKKSSSKRSLRKKDAKK